MITLNVNIDHVATVRQARGGLEPDPVAAAAAAELAGASGIVCHLREDRRHINDRDLRIIRDTVSSKLDLEMANNEEIIKIALETLPDMVTIVPEKRQELTTEGGLDVVSNVVSISSLSDRMHENGIIVSLFIEPVKAQIDASKKAGADMIEIHTGTYSNLKNKAQFTEFERIISAAKYAKSIGLWVAAGHGLNYNNTQLICSIKEIDELSIGHSIISRSVFTGIFNAVKEMRDLILNASLVYKK